MTTASAAAVSATPAAISSGAASLANGSLAEPQKEQYCNCWLSLGASGRGFAGLLEPIPRRPRPALLRPGLEKIAGLRLHDKIWIGLPRSTFGFWMELGW